MARLNHDSSVYLRQALLWLAYAPDGLKNLKQACKGHSLSEFRVANLVGVPNHLKAASLLSGFCESSGYSDAEALKLVENILTKSVLSNSGTLKNFVSPEHDKALEPQIEQVMNLAAEGKWADFNRAL